MAKKIKEKAATKMVVLSGEISEQLAEYLSRKESESANRVLRTVDVLADGSFREHKPTEEEVVAFIVKHPQYDDMLAKIKEERSKYIQRAERARKAREKVGKSASKDTDKSTTSLDHEGSNVSAQSLDAPTTNEATRINDKVLVDGSAEPVVELSSDQG
jgi:hypothetical protein